MKVVLSVLLLLVAVSCTPLMSPEDAAAARREVGGLLASGAVTQQQADWRMEDITRMEAFQTFDLGNLTEIAILILGGGGLGTALTRFTRGPPKKASPTEWAAMKAAAPRIG